MNAVEFKRKLFYLYIRLPGSRRFFGLLKKFWLPPHSVRKFLRFHGPFVLKVDDEVILNLMSYGNTIENELFWRGITGWEGRSVELWKRLSAKSKVILDIGANTGLYSLISSKVNPSASVYAFEPVELIFNRLKENIRLNHVKVNTHKIALAEVNGEGRIYAADTVSSTFDQASLNEANYKGKNARYQVIEQRRLSSFIEENSIGSLDLLKIDVETFEPHVLRGMGNYLKEFAPTLLIEILNETVARQVESLIEGIDYQYYLVDEKRGVLPASQLTPKGRGSNFLLLNRTKHPNFDVS